MAVHPLLLLLLLLLLRVISCYPASPSVLGINYGRVADNLPTPERVAPLLVSLGVGRIKLYDADPHVLRAFAGTGVEFVIGLPDECVVSAARDRGVALDWIRTNVAAYLPATRIVAVTVGNEVLSDNDTAVAESLLPAMKSVRASLASLNLDHQVAVTTAHSLAILSTSYPPSAGAFRRDLIPYISPLLEFLAETGSPFLINAYPYFAYKADPKRVPLDYVLFEPNSGVVDPGSGLRYDNMLHAQVDAVRSAIAAVGGKGKSGAAVELRVSETGWPSAGDDDEAGATIENAIRYNGNLMRMVTEGKGTPMKPTAPLHVYVFALFNEDMKPGPSSERHYGLFRPDGSPAYELGIASAPHSGGNTSGFSSGAQSPLHHAAASSTGYYSISSAMGKRWSRMQAVAAAVVVAVALRKP